MVRFVYLISFLASAVLSRTNKKNDVSKSIAETVNEFLKDLTPENIIEKMELHYKVLGLMDSDGEWVHRYFKSGSKGDYFLPRKILTSQDLVLLVNKMAENAEKNPYVRNALEVLQQGSYQKLERKLKEEGETVVINVVTLAMVLDKLTTVMKEDWIFLKVCNKIWSDNIPKILSATKDYPFEVAKALTIEESIRRKIQVLETKDVPPSYAINTLSFNIMEAVIQDESLGNLDNAETGIILAKYVHTPEKDNRTGSGPCQIAESQQGTECAQPLTLQWANLYSTWNLGEN